LGSEIISGEETSFEAKAGEIRFLVTKVPGPDWLCFAGPLNLLCFFV